MNIPKIQVEILLVKQNKQTKKKTQKTEQTKPPSKISTIKKNKCRRDLSIMVS